MPKVKLLRTKIVGPVGSTFRAFGHDFVIQPNREAHAIVHEDYIKAEVKAGRYVVIEDDSKANYEKEFGDLTFDVNQYFGAGDLAKLQKKIEKLRREALANFAETRLHLKFPDLMLKDEMMAEIMNIVAYKNRKPETDRSEKSNQLEELDKLEKKIAQRGRPPKTDSDEKS